MAITGWVLPKLLGNLDYKTPEVLSPDEEVAKEDRPSFAISLLVPLIPAIIMISALIANVWLKKGTQGYDWVNFVGSSPVAMTLAMLAAFYFFGLRQKRGIEWVMDQFGRAVKPIAMVVLIIGAGGALKQTIIDTGIGDYIGRLMDGGGANPYVMA